VPGPYLELFARQSRPGWDGFGNQEDLFDRGPVVTRRRPSRAV
jgi:N6-adenosine-specific RNA methylase IME4